MLPRICKTATLGDDEQLVRIVLRAKELYLRAKRYASAVVCPWLEQPGRKEKLIGFPNYFTSACLPSFTIIFSNSISPLILLRLINRNIAMTTRSAG